MGMKTKVPAIIALVFFTLAWVGYLITDQVHEGLQSVGFMYLAAQFLMVHDHTSP